MKKRTMLKCRSSPVVDEPTSISKPVFPPSSIRQSEKAKEPLYCAKGVVAGVTNEWEAAMGFLGKALLS